MKDKKLLFDRKCHVLYSKSCKKKIRAKIALHYPEEEREKVWEQVQRQYVDFLSDWRTDLGGKRNFHNGVGAYDITADELLAGTDTAKTESKTAQAQMLILELLADGKRMPSAELEKAVNERGISSRTMRTAKSRIGDRLVTEKDGTAWVCYLRD